MYLAYFDESGDPGVHNSPTDYFVLACFMVHENSWSDLLDELIRMRRHLRDKYGVPTRPEIKAQKHWVKGRPPLTVLGLGRPERMKMWRKVLAWVGDDLPIHTFAVAIEKEGADQKGWDPRMAAWKFALQRVDRFMADHDHESAMIFPDKGHGAFIRRTLRHIRRFQKIPRRWGRGTLDLPARSIVEDPCGRDSEESYFIQLSDWMAFAAHRSDYVDPTQRVPGNLWDALAPTLILDVNKVTGGPPGIVLYPS